MKFSCRLILTLVAFLFVVGCIGGDPYEDYVGKWERQGVKSAQILEITKDGETLLLNDNILRETDFFGKDKQAIVLKKNEDQLILEAGFMTAALGLSQDTNTLRIADRTYTRIDNSQFEKLKVQIEQERVEKEQNRKLCTALSSEFDNQRKTIMKEFAGDWQKRNEKIEKLRQKYKEEQANIDGCSFIFL